MRRVLQFFFSSVLLVSSALADRTDSQSGNRDASPEAQGRFDYQINEKFTPYRIPEKHLDPTFRRLYLQKLRNHARPSRLFYSREFSAWRNKSRYDQALNWGWADPKGFGRFNRISMQEKNILAIANHGGLLYARLLTGSDAANTGCSSNVDCYVWEEIGTRLKSPSFIADAAFKAHHSQGKNKHYHSEIVVIIPSDEDRGLMKMYETKNLGQTWEEVKISKGRGAGYYQLRNQGKYYGGNDTTELHQFPVTAPNSRTFRMFLYNYNDIDQQYGYYFDGKNWQPSKFDQVFPATNGNQIPKYAQQTYFTNTGFGLLTPHKNRLYLTKDFGASWEHLDYSTSIPKGKTVKSMAFGITEDGSTIYLAWNIDSSDKEVYFVKGTLDVGTTEGGQDDEYVWSQAYKLLKKNVQFMTIKADTINDLTLWYYMVGPRHTSNANVNDSAPIFTSLFPGNEYTMPGEQLSDFFINGAPYYFSMRYWDTAGVKKQNGGIFTYLPIDLREVFRHPDHPNETLLASDQGLYVVGENVTKKDSSYDVYLKNLAESRDHSEVYDVEVDACGSVYSGQWHGSATFTSDDESWIYRGGEAKGLFIGENRFNCSSGNEWIGNWGELNKETTFNSFAKRCEDDQAQFCKQKLISNKEHKKISGSSKYAKSDIPPVSVWLSNNPLPIPNTWSTFKSGTHFIYVGRDKGLYVLPESAVVSKSQGEPDAQLLDDRLWVGPTDTEKSFVLDDSQNILYAFHTDQPENPEGLFMNDLNGGGWQLITDAEFEVDGMKYSLDDKARVDAFDGEIVFSAKENFGTSPRRVVCVKGDKLFGASPLSCYALLSKSSGNASTFVDPWPNNSLDSYFQRVIIDRICPSRLYVILRNKKSAKNCTQKILVSDHSFEDQGVGKRVWQLFGDQVQCGIVHDVGFDVDQKLIYLATQGRGTMKGSLTNLHCSE